MRRLIKFGLSATLAASLLPQATQAVTLKQGTYQMQWQKREEGGSFPQYEVNLKKMSKEDAARFQGLASTIAYWGSEDGYTVVVGKSKADLQGFDVAYLLLGKQTGSINLKKAAIFDLEKNGSWGYLGQPDHPMLLGTDSASIPWTMGTQSEKITKTMSLSLSIKTMPDSTGKNVPTFADIEPESGWFGWIDTDEGKLRIELADDNGNRIYNDTATEDSCGDYIDILDPKISNYNWLIGTTYLGKVISYSNKLYTAEVSPTGNKLSIQPYKGYSGVIAINMVDSAGRPIKPSSIRFTGKQSSLAFGPGMDIYQLPLDEYGIMAIISTEVTATSQPNELIFYNTIPASVTTDGRVERTIGGPITIDIAPETPTLQIQPGKTLRATVSLKAGQDEVTYHGVNTPQVTIFGDDGQQVASGKVIIDPTSECIVEKAVVEIPKDLKPGTYKLKINLDASPYQSNVIGEKDVEVVE